ncbi:MAG: hypothetical protein GY832_17060 [Chloroflexi bacterium]|nr:hypothetical protein [Chloroflexota bacterium]
MSSQRQVNLVAILLATLLLIQPANTTPSPAYANVTPQEPAILLTTDRPIYRPGQTIHVRALAADAVTRQPLAGQAVQAAIANPQGIKVFQQETVTSDAGVAVWDFVISPLVGGGRYRVVATLGSAVSALTLWVEDGENPHFLVEPTFDQPFYLPGDQVSGYIRANYHYGRPVRDAQVELSGWAYDGGRQQVFARVSRTDELGFLHFVFALPDAFTAEHVGPEGADFVLEIAVTDQDDHTVRVSRRLPVGRQAIHIRAVPESGTLEPGVENIVYLLTAHPDATPADCQLLVELDDETYELDTGPLGVAELRLVPSGAGVTLRATARDQRDRTGRAVIDLPVAQAESALLLRPEQPLYDVGDTLQATVSSYGLDGRIHLGLLRQGLELDEQSIRIKGVTTTLSIPLAPGMDGLLELYAEKELPDGHVVSDTRTVLVRSGNDLDLQVNLDEPIYRPGDQARVTLDTRTRAGAPVSATVGIAVIDESVLYGQEPDPSIARWFLTLRADMLTPNRDPGHPFIPALLELPVAPDLVEARNAALSAALADWTLRPPLSSPITPTEQIALPAELQPSRIPSAPNLFPIALAILLPLGILAALVMLWRGGRLQRRSIIFTVGCGLLVGMALLSVNVFLAARRSSSPQGDSEQVIDQIEGLLESWRISVEGSGPGGANPRRSYDPILDPVFPTTMAWYSATQTSDLGHLELDLQLPKIITPTWRLIALANTQDGQIGWASVPIPAYQELWAEIEMPSTLRYNEQTAVPVDVYNYQGDDQTVRVSLPPERWFQHVETPTQEIELPPGEMRTIYFPIQITWGRGRVRPHAEISGRNTSDDFVARSPSEIIPDGQRFDQDTSDWLPGSTTIPLSIPGDAIPGTGQIDVKIYPSTLSQIAEGIDNLLGVPHGCFEQANSVTYPNVMALQFLQAVEQVNWALAFKANSYLSQGYQLVASFEVPGGGFSLWGDPPADRMLSAYGLMLLADMAQVYPVDENLTERTAAWLFDQQNPDDTWDNDQGLVHETSWSDLGNSRLPVTAYVAWALARAGYGDDARTQAGLDYVRAHLDQAQDPYVLALCANALVAADPASPSAQTAVNRLAGAAVVRGNVAYWPNDVVTFVGSGGVNGSVETTALAAQAMMRADSHPDLSSRALGYLMQQKGAAGAWGTTQSTVLALQALQLAALKGGDETNATVQVSVNGQMAAPMHFTPDNSDIARTVSFTDVVVPLTNTVQIDVQGTGNLAYHIHTSYYVPWPQTSTPTPTGAIDMVVQYDQARLRVGDETKVMVHIPLREGTVEWGIAELVIPPGFEADAAELERLLSKHRDPPPGHQGAKITRIDREAERIIVYFEKLEAGRPLDFDFHLRARSPVRLRTQTGRVYDYYNPDVSADAAPVEIEVVE